MGTSASYHVTSWFQAASSALEGWKDGAEMRFRASVLRFRSTVVHFRGSVLRFRNSV